MRLTIYDGRGHTHPERQQDYSPWRLLHLHSKDSSELIPEMDYNRLALENNSKWAFSIKTLAPKNANTDATVKSICSPQGNLRDDLGGFR
jgi:hypothetical protein